MRWQLLLGMGLVVALAAVGAGIACGGEQEAPSATTTAPADDPKAMGPADAAVTVVEYADFQ